MKKQIAMTCLTVLAAASAFAAKPTGPTTRELTYAGLPTITYVNDSDGLLSEVRMGGKQIVAYDWTSAPYALPVRFFNRWTLVTTVLPDGSASQEVMDSHGVQRASGTVLPHGREFPHPTAVLDAFAADLGLSAEWQQGMEMTPAGEVRLHSNGKIITLRYHAAGEGVRVGEWDGKPVLWDLDLPLGVSGRLGELIPSRLIVTSTGAVQLAADIPFVNGIESMWTNDSSGSHVSFRTPRADATVHAKGFGPHVEMMVVCGYTEFDSCWDYPGGAVCNSDVFFSYCDNGGGGYTPPPDGGTAGPGGGPGTRSNNQISDPTLHAAVDDGKGNAMAKLQSAQCQQMIRNNTNAAGMSLWTVLTSYSPDPSTYIDTQITFVKGNGTFDIASNLVPCNYDRLAWTSVPGVHTVDICGSFQTLSTGMRGVTLIHEMLHTLGLPEYPNDPTGYRTEDIQQMVVNWCGGQ